MKTIIDYITEKFKINSKTVKNNKIDKDISINVKQSYIKSFDSEKIIDFAKNLSILPDNIVSTSTGNIITLNFKKNDKCFIMFSADGIQLFQVAFRKSLKENIIFYPTADKYFKTLNECFKCIEKHWDDWEKYLE